MNEKTKPEIIRSVADGDKMVLNYPEYSKEELHKEYMWFQARASEINNANNDLTYKKKEKYYCHYRISKVTALLQIVIIAERRKPKKPKNKQLKKQRI